MTKKDVAVIAVPGAGSMSHIERLLEEYKDADITILDMEKVLPGSNKSFDAVESIVRSTPADIIILDLNECSFSLKEAKTLKEKTTASFFLSTNYKTNILSELFGFEIYVGMLALDDIYDIKKQLIQRHGCEFGRVQNHFTKIS